ncbi:MAG TPA: 23S rRNA (uracil(1939)-C(5))-methyltransferase RlmD [Pseudomonadales bacterium]|nr:23S rRNA (uracil(1939)-C(5))-methyltransferase RlmD [Pseudomonadales bacterium]HNL91648.1 23S rRNA (uracil(1939)-C(5))-methyltransferase RlmD [Pseudomonadales bacterium]
MKELTIESLAHDLRGVAHADGVVWLVDGALPAENVLVRERARYSQRVEADVEQVLQASPTRIAPPCEYASVCGGCDVQYMDYATQLANKERVLKEQLARIENIATVQWLPTLAAEPWAYRRRARIACRGLADKKHLALGFRQRHSHAIVEIEHCAILVPALQALLPSLRQCLSRWSQPRQLGHIELLAADNGVGMLLRVTAALSPVDEALLQAFAAEQTVTVFIQQEEKKSAQYAFGKEQTLLLQHEKSGVALACMPGDFLQANGVLNALLVDAVLAALSPSKADSVLEAFCGLGNFTLPLAKQVGKIVAMEVSETMVSRAKKQAADQNVRNVSWMVSDLAQKKNCETIKVNANKVLLDPPREGAAVFCQHAPLDGVERITYVSCNPSSFARDAAILAQRGFVLSQVGMVDMFPQTSHIEVLAVFDVQSNSKIKKHSASKKTSMKKLKR